MLWSLSIDRAGSSSAPECWPLQLALGLVGGLQGWNLEEPCPTPAGDTMAQAGEGQYGAKEEASGSGGGAAGGEVRTWAHGAHGDELGFYCMIIHWRILSRRLKWSDLCS